MDSILFLFKCAIPFSLYLWFFPDLSNLAIPLNTALSLADTGGGGSPPGGGGPNKTPPPAAETEKLEKLVKKLEEDKAKEEMKCEEERRKTDSERQKNGKHGDVQQGVSQIRQTPAATK